MWWWLRWKIWGPTRTQVESLLQELGPQMSAETAIEGFVDWLARAFGDKREQADVTAVEAALDFWRNPSAATKAKAIADVKAAIAAYAAVNPLPVQVPGERPPQGQMQHYSGERGQSQYIPVPE